MLDFGIARADRSTGITRPGWLIGTPAYRAPEQARGELHVDARVDVFALGCVLFECLTGGPAFRGDHLAAILAKVRFAETPSARALRPDVPAPLDALLARMGDALRRAREGARPAPSTARRDRGGRARAGPGHRCPARSRRRAPGRDRRPPERERGAYRPWAELLRRTLAIDVLACPACKGRMKLVAMLTEPRSIARFLTALGEPTDVPVRSPLCQRRVRQTAPGNLW
ncbi:protein kinase domain-containing protein [Sorangium sp. So ce385]|uniref:protein kinase domain-containing protein n=1 Tax=Sorangium sp. So ce385 TaxID=3133308 RepID=UPI003F5B3BAE